MYICVVLTRYRHTLYGHNRVVALLRRTSWMLTWSWPTLDSWWGGRRRHASISSYASLSPFLYLLLCEPGLGKQTVAWHYSQQAKCWRASVLADKQKYHPCLGFVGTEHAKEVGHFDQASEQNLQFHLRSPHNYGATSCLTRASEAEQLLLSLLGLRFVSG